MTISLSNITSWFATAETDIETVIADVESVATAAEADAAAVEAWIATNAPTIISDATKVANVLTTLGVGIAPQFSAAVNTVVVVLNAIMAAQTVATPPAAPAPEATS